MVDEDGAVVFQHPWLRLCRRIVRDYKFRGSDAHFTLKMWPNVRRGEKLYISPYKENADLMFDSSLPDEVAVLKPFVVPLLEALPQGKYEIADDILRGFERIEIMEESKDVYKRQLSALTPRALRRRATPPLPKKWRRRPRRLPITGRSPASSCCPAPPAPARPPRH